MTSPRIESRFLALKFSITFAPRWRVVTERYFGATQLFSRISWNHGSTRPICVSALHRRTIAATRLPLSTSVPPAKTPLSSCCCAPCITGFIGDGSGRIEAISSMASLLQRLYGREVSQQNVPRLHWFTKSWPFIKLYARKSCKPSN
jgi:hypothetical protein